MNTVRLYPERLPYQIYFLLFSAVSSQSISSHGEAQHPTFGDGDPLQSSNLFVDIAVGAFILDE